MKKIIFSIQKQKWKTVPFESFVCVDIRRLNDVKIHLRGHEIKILVIHGKGTRVFRDLKVENRLNTRLSCIGRFCHVGHGFLKIFSYICNSNNKVNSNKVPQREAQCQYINKTPELSFKFSASLPLSRNTESFNKIKLHPFRLFRMYVN